MMYNKAIKITEQGQSINMLRQVKTEYGTVQGLPAADPRITAFKGIPFASPPVGDLRFAPPQKAKPWDGVKECYRFSPIPMQPAPERNPRKDDLYAREWAVDYTIELSEDCLYLNVWTPAKEPTEKLPVYFWIYGGGFQVGHSAEMEFDGERIARRGIVVVTINYRVNLFGFTSHPELTKEYPNGPANAGLLDQQMALKWTYDNIENFGGDKNNITIGGQSAGAGSVLNHIQNDESRKYFKRAVVESGLFYNPFFPMFRINDLKTAEQTGVTFFEFCGAKNLSEMRKIPSAELWKKWDEWGGWEKSLPTWPPCTDNLFIKHDFLQGVKDGKFTVPPLLIGYTKDEFLFGPTPDSAEKDKINIVELGIRKLCKNLEANGINAKNFYYKFEVPIPGWDNPGDFHSVDLWFFFETLAKCWRPFTGMHYDIARKMCDYLCNFVKNGDPNGSGKDSSDEVLPEWKAYSSNEPNMMIFGTECACKKTEAEEKVAKFLE